MKSLKRENILIIRLSLCVLPHCLIIPFNHRIHALLSGRRRHGRRFRRNCNRSSVPSRQYLSVAARNSRNSNAERRMKDVPSSSDARGLWQDCAVVLLAGSALQFILSESVTVFFQRFRKIGYGYYVPDKFFDFSPVCFFLQAFTLYPVP